MGLFSESTVVQCLVIERFRKEVESPEAHALSPRSLEIARQFGLDVKHMRSLGTSREDAYWVNFCSSLGGEHLGRFRYERMDKEVLEVTPEVRIFSDRGSLSLRLTGSDDTQYASAYF